MVVATFDTLKFANSLKAAGVPDKQAEAEAAAISEALAANFKDLATKDDLLQLRTELKNELLHVRTELKNELLQVRTELKNDIRETEQRLNAKIDGVSAKIDSSTAKIQGEMTLMKYMFGICITLLLGLVGLGIRLLFVRAA